MTSVKWPSTDICINILLSFPPACTNYAYIWSFKKSSCNTRPQRSHQTIEAKRWDRLCFLNLHVAQILLWLKLFVWTIKTVLEKKLFYLILDTNICCWLYQDESFFQAVKQHWFHTAKKKVWNRMYRHYCDVSLNSSNILSRQKLEILLRWLVVKFNKMRLNWIYNDIHVYICLMHFYFKIISK
jgi:hypothetical protein